MSHDQVIERLLDEAFAAHETGDVDLLARRARAVLEMAPENYDALGLLGLAALHAQDFASAQDWFSRAVAMREGESDAHINLGLAYVALGRHDEALQAFDRALSLDHGSGAAHFGRGVALHLLRRLDAAEASLRRAALLQPEYAESHLRHAQVLLELQRFDESAQCYERVLHLQPDSDLALVGHANACMQLEQYERALTDYDKLLAKDAKQVEVLSNRGSALLHLDRVPEAIDMFKQGLALSPDNATLMSNLCSALHRALAHEEALSWSERAVTIDPLLARAHSNRGHVLMDCGRLDEAAESLSRAAALDPSDSEARWAWGWSRLLAGDWKLGLQLFESRRGAVKRHVARSFTEPVWRGDFSLAGRTILLHADHGLGDTIMFSRYAPMVEALGARVILQVQPALKELMKSLAGHADIIGMDEKARFDCHCPLMSLPLAFETTPASIPSPSRYLAAPADRLSAASRRLGGTMKLRVGVAWSGSASHTDDSLRSMSLSTLMSALPHGAEYYCLQKDIGDSYRHVVGTMPQLVYLPLATFEDTAAFIEHMDLVLTVDTSIAHLAGALGRPTWILLSKRPDWRWLLERRDTPWYASARLFRQSEWRDWSNALRELREELETKLVAHTSSVLRVSS